MQRAFLSFLAALVFAAPASAQQIFETVGIRALGMGGAFVAVADDATAERMFAALADGGQVHVPIGPSFFATRFGMLADRFGVAWMVVTDAQH